MPTASVTLPDGRRARVTFDSQEQLDAVINDLVGPQRSGGEDAARQLGMGVRSVARGLMASNPFSIAADAAGGLYNTVADAVGIPGYRSYPIGDLATRASDAVGLPKPQTEAEKRISRVNEIGAGAAGTMAAARAAGGGLAQVLAANPVQQSIASTGGPLIGEGMRYGGVPEPWPTVAEIGAGFLTPSDSTLSRVAGQKDVGGLIRGAGDVARTVPRTAAGRTVGGVKDVLTTKGRQNVVGRILRSGSNDPISAERTLANIPEYVAGSRPTIGQASRDVGLQRLESIAENSIDLPDVVTSPGTFAAQRTRNTTARNAAMAALKPVDENFEKLRQGINSRFQPRLDSVMQNRRFAQTQPVIAQIDEILTTPGLGQRQELVDNLTYARQRIEDLGPTADPKDLQAVRQDISDLIEGKLKGAATRDGKAVGGGVKGLSRIKMRAVVDGLDDAIEQGAPGYKAKWLTPYAKARQELDRRKIVGEAYGKAQTTKDNADGMPVLSAAGMDRWFKANSAKVARLTPQQRQTLLKIRADLKRASSGDSAEVQGVGSSTAKNIVGGASVASIIGRAMGGDPQRSPIPLGDKWRWLFGYTDRQINDLLIEAMTDPVLGRKLLSQANKQAMDEAGKALEDLAIKRSTASSQINIQKDRE